LLGQLLAKNTPLILAATDGKLDALKLVLDQFVDLAMSEYDCTIEINFVNRYLRSLLLLKRVTPFVAWLY
jgi:hypothetical protein